MCCYSFWEKDIAIVALCDSDFSTSQLFFESNGSRIQIHTPINTAGTAAKAIIEIDGINTLFYLLSRLYRTQAYILHKVCILLL